MARNLHYTTTITAGELIGTLTLRVRFFGIAKLRMSLAARMMVLVGLMAGCAVEVEIVEQSADRPARG